MSKKRRTPKPINLMVDNIQYKILPHAVKMMRLRKITEQDIINAIKRDVATPSEQSKYKIEYEGIYTPYNTPYYFKVIVRIKDERHTIETVHQTKKVNP